MRRTQAANPGSKFLSQPWRKNEGCRKYGDRKYGGNYLKPSAVALISLPYEAKHLLPRGLVHLMEEGSPIHDLYRPQVKLTGAGALYASPRAIRVRVRVAQLTQQRPPSALGRPATPHAGHASSAARSPRRSMSFEQRWKPARVLARAAPNGPARGRGGAL